MATPRKPTLPTTDAIDTFCARFDDLFNRRAARQAVRHYPLGVKPYWPASRLPGGKQDPRFRTKPMLAWELIEEAWQSGIPFRAVVADCIYGEHPTLTANLFCAAIPYVVAIHSNHGVWQFVEDPANPPAFNPHEAAQRVPLERWQRVVRRDSHGKELVHYVVELELGNAYG